MPGDHDLFGLGETQELREIILHFRERNFLHWAISRTFCASIRLFAGLSVLAVAAWVVNKEHRLGSVDGCRCRTWSCSAGLTSYGAATWGDDVAMLVEIADSSYARDGGVKMRRYAGFGIPVYWIVDLNRRVVEVRTLPSGKGKNALTTLDAMCTKSLTASLFRWTEKEVGSIAVAGILP